MPPAARDRHTYHGRNGFLGAWAPLGAPTGAQVTGERCPDGVCRNVSQGLRVSAGRRAARAWRRGSAPACGPGLVHGRPCGRLSLLSVVSPGVKRDACAGARGGGQCGPALRGPLGHPLGRPRGARRNHGHRGARHKRPAEKHAVCGPALEGRRGRQASLAPGRSAPGEHGRAGRGHCGAPLARARARGHRSYGRAALQPRLGGTPGPRAPCSAPGGLRCGASGGRLLVPRRATRLSRTGEPLPRHRQRGRGGGEPGPRPRAGASAHALGLFALGRPRRRGLGRPCDRGRRPSGGGCRERRGASALRHAARRGGRGEKGTSRRWHGRGAALPRRRRTCGRRGRRLAAPGGRPRVAAAGRPCQRGRGALALLGRGWSRGGARGRRRGSALPRRRGGRGRRRRARGGDSRDLGPRRCNHPLLRPHVTLGGAPAGAAARRRGQRSRAGGGIGPVCRSPRQGGQAPRQVGCARGCELLPRLRRRPAGLRRLD